MRSGSAGRSSRRRGRSAALADSGVRGRRRAFRAGAGLRVRDPRLAPAPALGAARARRCGDRSRASSRRAARSSCTATASAPSMRGRSRCSCPRGRTRRSCGGSPPLMTVEAVPAGGPGAVVDWCRLRELGLEASVVDELLGPERLAERERGVLVQRLRVAGALVLVARAAGGRPRRDRGSGSAHAARANGRGTAPLGGLYVNCGDKGEAGQGVVADSRPNVGYSGVWPVMIDVRRRRGPPDRRTSLSAPYAAY